MCSRLEWFCGIMARITSYSAPMQVHKELISLIPNSIVFGLLYFGVSGLFWGDFLLGFLFCFVFSDTKAIV